MELDQIIALNEQNIRTALKDYARHTYKTDIIDDVSDTFIHNLARDNAEAKCELRELFRKSPVWDEQLEALVINGTRTHNPDAKLILTLAVRILNPVAGTPCLPCGDAEAIEGFFSEEYWYNENHSEWDEETRNYYNNKRNKRIEIINRIAPKAYTPGKKLSRVFKAICDALGITDATAGSEFQRLYAQFADELTAKKIGFKLFISINPAHFLTMSNPKDDKRGSTLTSCHSFNSTEYIYNNGCSGYARDDTSFIVFTVEDPSVPELFNNRKTTRQIFAYRPGGGVLLQSRLYNTSGGTRGAQEESTLYRDLVQREISNLEKVPNLWKTYNSCGSDKSHLVRTGDGFGGYEDWIYADFNGKISIRNDREDNCTPITVGTWGLCISCGGETQNGLYCEDCKDYDVCDECEESFSSSDLYTVYNSHGDSIRVCERCRDEYYRYCDECNEYHPVDNTRWVGDICVCDDCYAEYYETCDCCGESWHEQDMRDAVDSRGNHIRICKDCADEHYHLCDECGDYVHTDDVWLAQGEHGSILPFCPSCRDELCTECVDCRELFVNRALNSQGRCADCAEKAEEDTTDEIKEDAV